MSPEELSYVMDAIAHFEGKSRAIGERLNGIVDAVREMREESLRRHEEEKAFERAVLAALSTIEASATRTPPENDLVEEKQMVEEVAENSVDVVELKDMSFGDESDTSL